MPTTENLQIVIQVFDQFSQELRDLQSDLAAVEAAVQATDDIRIDVDVRGQGQLTALQGQLATLEGMDLGGVGNVGVGAGGGGGGGGGASFGGGDGDIGRLLRTQVAQMGRIIRDVNADMDDMGRSFANTMSAADKAADSFDITNIRMSDMHNAMAQLLPTLVVFIGALPAAVAGIVALGAAAFAAAAGLAAIGGFGLMGAASARGDGDMMEGAQDILNEVTSDFTDAFSDISQRLAPLFEDFLDGLDRMFQQIANLEGILMNLTDEARAFGDFMSEWMVGLIRDLGLMAEAFAPVFGMIADFAEDMDLLEALTVFMSEALPDLVIMNRLLIGLLTRLTGMSQGFLEVANAVGIFLSFLFQLLNVMGFTNKEIGILIGFLLISITVVNLLSATFIRALIPALLQAGSYLIGMAGAVLSSNTTLLSYIGTVSGASLASLAFSVSLYQILAALIVVTGGVYALIAAVGFLSSQFADVGADIDSATDSLEDFQAQQDSMGSGGQNPYRDPDTPLGTGTGRSRFSGGDINVSIEGDADEESVRNQTQNALYRMERPSRGR